MFNAPGILRSRPQVANTGIGCWKEANQGRRPLSSVLLLWLLAVSTLSSIDAPGGAAQEPNQRLAADEKAAGGDTADTDTAGGDTAGGDTGDGDTGGVIIERSRGEPKRFRWDFSRKNDRNFNGWPDGWKRYRGPGHPQYVEIGIVPHNPDAEAYFRKLDAGVIRLHRWLSRRWPSWAVPVPPNLSDSLVDRYLRIDLDGGLAKAQSSSVEASWLYQYRFRCRIMTEGLRYDRARAALVFVDADGQELASHTTRPITGTSPWTELQVDRIRPPAEASGMSVRLVVEGSEDGLEDVGGAIGLDDVVIEKFPQLSITTDKPLGIYPSDRRPRVTATVMGLPSVTSSLRFRLMDRDGVELASHTMPLGAAGIAVQPGSGRSRNQSIHQRGEPSDATRQWQLPPLGPGFYRVTVALEDEDPQDLVSETTLAMIEELVPGPTHGVFGWTLPNGLAGSAGERSVKPREVGRWLADLGVAWVKFPCWLPPDDDVAADHVASVLSRMQDHGIQTIGMLDEPPESELPNYDVRGRRIPSIADLLRDVETWQPLLEPVMTRLTLKVKRWQLGADRDHSFVGRPRLDESIREIAKGLQGFGQPIEVAIAWPWLEPHPPDEDASWNAVTRSSDPELTADELDAFLTNELDDRARAEPRTWLLLSPISKTMHARDQRVRDLVMRMAAVRKHAVQAAFVSDPRDREHGLLRADGRPGEMLLPWRTTARLIGNLNHAGSLQLRSGAHNAVFSDHRRAVLMVWAAEPTEELIYLGPSARQVDVWGRAVELPSESYGGHEVQRVSIGTTPSFLVDVDPTLLEFRMSVQLKQKQLDSVLGDRQRMSVSFRNPTSDNLTGEIEIAPPGAWEVQPETPYWELLRGRETAHPFDVVLSNSASVGTYELPIHFKLQTVPPQEITVHREIQVGPEGLDMDVQTRLTENGDLEVRLQMTNQSDAPQAYDCLLFPGQGRQYDRRIIRLDVGETQIRLFRWPDGQELLDKTILLRATEQDGRRVLNYSVVAKP